MKRFKRISAFSLATLISLSPLVSPILANGQKNQKKTTKGITRSVKVVDSKVQKLHGNFEKELTDKFYGSQPFKNPKALISKSEFIMLLMKTEKVLQGRPVVNMTPYTTVDKTGKLYRKDFEYIEESKYADKLGDLGLSRHNGRRILLSYLVYGKMSVAYNPNVLEQYLSIAYEKELFKKEDLINEEGTQGSNFLKFLNSENKNKARWDDTRAQYLNFNNLQPTIKIIRNPDGRVGAYKRVGGEDESFREQRIGNQTFSYLENSKFWGDSFIYEHVGGSKLTNESDFAKLDPMVNVMSIQIRKRPSILSDSENGYRYFVNERINNGEAFILVDKFLQSKSDEAPPDPELLLAVDIQYGNNLNQLSNEELESARRLVALGVIDGDDIDLLSNNELTYQSAVKIAYALASKEHRHKVERTITETDRAMAQMGYSKSFVKFSPTKDIMPEIKMVKRDGENNKFKTRRVYKYFIRTPEKFNNQTDKLDLIIDGSHNTPSEILPYQEIGVDASNHSWRLYTVDRDITSSLRLKGTVGNIPYNITGLSNDGVYLTPDNNPIGEFLRIPPSDILKADVPTNALSINKGDKSNSVYVFMINTFKVLGTEESKTVYGDPPQPRPNYIEIGPSTGEDLEQLLYSGELFFDRVTEKVITSSKFAKDYPSVEITKTNVTENCANHENNLTTYYTLKVPVESYDGRITLSKIQSKFSMLTKESETQNTIGYAKVFDGRGQQVTLISKNELSKIKIPYKSGGTVSYGEIIVPCKDNGKDCSDKILMNTATGQKAFIDTVANLTIIGNNITHYGKMDTLVNSAPQKDNNEVFYNLDIILELINDRNLTRIKQGRTETITTSNDANESRCLDKYTTIDIVHGDYSSNDMYNRTRATSRGVLFNDYKKGDMNVYLNLSSLVGDSSNFIYYKNKQGSQNEHFNALIVYTPKQVGLKYKEPVDNSFKTAMSHKYGVFDKYNQENINNQYKSLKKLLTQNLFKGSETGDGQILDDTYKFDIYILNQEDEETKKESLVKFLSVLFGNASDQETLQKLIDEINKELLPTIDSNDLETLNKVMSKDITINVIKVQKNVDKDIDKKVEKLNNAYPTKASQLDNSFLVQGATGNLYYLIGKYGENGGLNKSQRIKFNSIFGSTMYMGKAPYGSDLIDILRFRPRHYYENTPFGFIPLERLGDGASFFDSISFKSDGTPNKNFEPVQLTVKWKEGVPLNERIRQHKIGIHYDKNVPFRNSRSANGVLPKYEVSETFEKNFTDEFLSKQHQAKVGMVTQLELPYRALPLISNGSTFEPLNVKIINFSAPYNQTLESTNEVKEVNTTVLSNQINFIHFLFSLNAYYFDKETNSTLTNLGNGKTVKDDGSYTITPQANKTFSIFDSLMNFVNDGTGYSVNNHKLKLDYMSGTWNGVSSTTGYEAKVMSDRQYDFRSFYNLVEAISYEQVGILKNKSNINELITGKNGAVTSGMAGEFSNKKFIVLVGGENAISSLSPSEEIRNGKLVAIKIDKNSSNKDVGVQIYKSLLGGIANSANLNHNLVEMKVISDPSELASFAYDSDSSKPYPIYWKPSIGIPHGTNVVDKDGFIHTIRNESPRDEIIPAYDIINNMIQRVKFQEYGNNKEGQTFISELPDGAILRLKNVNNIMFKKVSGGIKTTNQDLEWIKTLSLETQPREIHKLDVDDFNLMLYIKQNFLSHTLPYNETPGLNIPFYNIVAKNKYSVPNINEFKDYQSITSTNKKFDDLLKELISDEKVFWFRDLSDSKRFQILPYIYKDEWINDKFQSLPVEEQILSGNLTPIINMPPTLTVEESEEKGIWYITGYWDISMFRVDKDNTYVELLAKRNTKADLFASALSQIDSLDLSGWEFLNQAKQKMAEDDISKIREFIQYGVPLLATTFLMLSILFYTGLRIPLTRDMIYGIFKSFRLKRLVESMDYGKLSLDKLPNLLEFTIMMIFIAGIIAITYSNMLWNLVEKLTS